MNHTELEYDSGSEVKIIANDIEEIKRTLMASNTYKRLEHYNSKIAILNIRDMSKQISEKDFEEELKRLVEKGNENPEDEDAITEEDLPALRANRYMECICVKDGTDLRVLCDDSRSLMRTIYNMKLVLLRIFNCDVDLSDEDS